MQLEKENSTVAGNIKYVHRLAAMLYIFASSQRKLCFHEQTFFFFSILVETRQKLYKTLENRNYNNKRCANTKT